VAGGQASARLPDGAATGNPKSEVRNPKEKLAGDERRFVLLAMHQTLVERASPTRQGERQ